MGRRKTGNYRTTFTSFDIKLLNNYHEKINIFFVYL